MCSGELMVVTSIFSYCHMFSISRTNIIFQLHLFCCLQILSIRIGLKLSHLVKSQLFIWEIKQLHWKWKNLMEFSENKMLSCTMNPVKVCRLIHIASIWRLVFKQKMKMSLMGRKHHGQRRKTWSTAFSLPRNFSKASFLRVVKTWHFPVDGENNTK